MTKSSTNGSGSGSGVVVVDPLSSSPRRVSRRASLGAGTLTATSATHSHTHTTTTTYKTSSTPHTTDNSPRRVSRRASLGALPTASHSNTQSTPSTPSSPTKKKSTSKSKNNSNLNKSISHLEVPVTSPCPSSPSKSKKSVSKNLKDKSKLMGTRSPKKTKQKLTVTSEELYLKHHQPSTTSVNHSASTEQLQTLQEAFQAIQPYVDFGSSKASRAVRKLEKAIDVVVTAVTHSITSHNDAPQHALKNVKLTLLVEDPTPNDIGTMLPPNTTLGRATYAANAPSEDRSTVVVGDTFLFAGVWDGHGGTPAAEYTAHHIWPNFCAAYMQKGLPVGPALQAAMVQTDKDYLEHARTVNQPTVFFAGTCAVAVFIDLVSGQVTCANLGDSRAVMGVYTDTSGSDCKCVPLSVDHAADNPAEQARLRADHADDPDVLVNMDDTGNDPDWRVKKMAAFTRSIGDLHLKDKNTAALFNSYVPEHQRIQPRPGVKLKKTGVKKKKYISNEAEIQQATIDKQKAGGFVILACDGVWDEMSSEEAVRIVSWLMAQYDPEEYNIAELFIEETLKHAVRRIAASYEEEANLTLAELKKRPPGKQQDSHRSMLHDDITVVIIQLGNRPSQHGSLFNMLQSNTKQTHNKLMDPSLYESPSVSSMNRTKHKREMAVRSSSLDISHHVEALMRDAERKFVDKQILEMMNSFDEMGSKSLQILFHAVDVDGNGTLDREEVTRLVRHVIQMDVSPAVIDLAFSEMDANGSGDVDLDEFIQFFGG
eukprot:scaffold5479_cov199-Amphora_coffeaeformis.AAC.5